MNKGQFALLASLLVSFANATTVTIDPEGLAEGTNISNAYPGVTLRHYSVVRDVDAPDGARVVVGDVYVAQCSTPWNPMTKCGQLGTGQFGFQDASGTIWQSYSAQSTSSITCITTGSPGPCKWMEHEFLDATFAAPVQEVTIDGTHLSDWPHAWAFDAAGNLLQVDLDITWNHGTDTCGTSTPTYCHQTLTVTPLTGQISRVVFAGVGGYVMLDKLTYTVP